MTSITQIVHPTFEITIPSTGRKVTSRPIITRERKALLTALASEEASIISHAVKSIIGSCLQSVQIDDLTTFDFEWIFLQLIINSVKETIDLEVRIPNRENECPDCGKPRLINVSLRDAQIEGLIREKADFLVEIYSGVGIKLRYPTEKIISALETTNPDKSEIEKLTDLIALSIESVYDQSGIKPFADFEYAAQIEFLDSLPIAVTEKLEAFVESIPRVELKVIVECPKCKFRALHTMKGLADFFV